MGNQSNQEKEELSVFARFLDIAGMQKGTFESRQPPEPDILYSNASEIIAFELCEVADEKLARTIAEDMRNNTTTAIYTKNNAARCLEKKLNKEYISKHPIELLLYGGRDVTPDELAIFELQDLLSVVGKISFRKIWYWGDQIHLVYPNPPSASAVP